MSWVIVKNPNAEGPRPLGGACHDGSPFLTIGCGCGEMMHIHETQLAAAPNNTIIETRCLGCNELLELQVGMIRDAISKAWIR